MRERLPRKGVRHSGAKQTVFSADEALAHSIEYAINEQRYYALANTTHNHEHQQRYCEQALWHAQQGALWAVIRIRRLTLCPNPN